jgi:HEPN domain-containing protein
MKKLTAEWVKKAEDDFRVAQRLLRGRVQFPDQICFHCQQAIEKYLKAMLQEAGVPFPKTHDILQLIDLLIPIDRTLRRLRRGSRRLTRYAVDYRYPGLHTTVRQARAAYAKGTLFRAEIRKRLGLRMGS